MVANGVRKMSREAECGWTLLRAITISLVATPLAAVLAQVLENDSPRHRRRRLLALAIPFLTPGFVVGYASWHAGASRKKLRCRACEWR